jgi:hypothetical protein
MVFESPGLGMARPVYGKPVARVRGSSSVRPPQSLQHFSPRKNWGTTNAVEIRPARTIIFSLLFRIGPDQRKLTKRKLEQNKFFFFSGIRIFFKVENVGKERRTRFLLGARAHRSHWWRQPSLVRNVWQPLPFIPLRAGHGRLALLSLPRGGGTSNN